MLVLKKPYVGRKLFICLLRRLSHVGNLVLVLRNCTGVSFVILNPSSFALSATPKPFKAWRKYFKSLFSLVKKSYFITGFSPPLQIQAVTSCNNFIKSVIEAMLQCETCTRERNPVLKSRSKKSGGVSGRSEEDSWEWNFYNLNLRFLKGQELTKKSNQTHLQVFFSLSTSFMLINEIILTCKTNKFSYSILLLNFSPKYSVSRWFFTLISRSPKTPNRASDLKRKCAFFIVHCRNRNFYSSTVLQSTKKTNRKKIIGNSTPHSMSSTVQKGRVPVQ